jgi:hypothetical protein
VRVLFKGPEGAYWAGKELRAASVDTAKISALADLQLATGWTMPQIMKHAELEMVGVRILSFLTLRSAGMFVSWDEVGDIVLDDLEIIADPGDPQVVEDPQGARGGSTPGDAPDTAADAPASPRKPKKSGSATRSAPAK